MFFNFEAQPFYIKASIIENQNHRLPIEKAEAATIFSF